MPAPPEPSWRKPVGVLAILLITAIWAIIVVSLVGRLGPIPLPVALILYAVAGIVWILPLKPLLRWMETGRFR